MTDKLYKFLYRTDSYGKNSITVGGTNSGIEDETHQSSKN